MMFYLLEKPSGDRMDEAVAHYRTRTIRSLTVRVFEENSRLLRNRLDVEEIVALMKAIGLRIENLVDFPSCVRALDMDGLIILIDVKPGTPFPENLRCVNFDLLKDRHDQILDEERLLTLYSCKLSYVLKE
jgi:hypothetical protein